MVGKPKVELKGPTWRFRFNRLGTPGLGERVLIYDALFVATSPDVVLKEVRLSLMGMPLAKLTGFHRKVPSR